MLSGRRLGGGELLLLKRGFWVLLESWKVEGLVSIVEEGGPRGFEKWMRVEEGEVPTE